MQQSDKELVEALRRRAKAMTAMYGGYGYDTAERLQVAADRITELAQANHDIRHLWYKGKEMCAICAHKCTNVEADSCGECKRECPCLVCEGENWEEARDNG